MPKPRSQLTFLRYHDAGIASIVLFVVHTISFNLLHSLVTLATPPTPEDGWH